MNNQKRKKLLSFNFRSGQNFLVWTSMSGTIYYGRALGPEGKFLFFVLATFYLKISKF